MDFEFYWPQTFLGSFGLWNVDFELSQFGLIGLSVLTLIGGLKYKAKFILKV